MKYYGWKIWLPGQGLYQWSPCLEQMEMFTEETPGVDGCGILDSESSVSALAEAEELGAPPYWMSPQETFLSSLEVEEEG